MIYRSDLISGHMWFFATFMSFLLSFPQSDFNWMYGKERSGTVPGAMCARISCGAPASSRAGVGRRSFGDRVIGMKGGEQRRAVNARSSGPPQIFCERRIGIPRAGQPVAFSGMTMAINDHC
jgi:hypothetical protein